MNEQEREEWLTQRRTGLGSSDAAAACGLCPYRTPLHLYLDKLGALPASDSQPMAWGRRLEAVVAEAYAERTGRCVLPPAVPLLRHPEYPWLLASLDRLARDPLDERVLEIKTARTAEGWGPEDSDQIPQHILIQVQHQLFVSGHAQADVCVLIGGQELRIYEITRRQDLIRYLLEIEGAFWCRIENRVPPEPDWRHPDTPRLLDLLYRPDPGRTVELNWNAYSLATWYRALGEEARAAEQERERLRAKLVAVMGEASVGLLPDGSEIRRKVIPAKEMPAHVRREYTTFTVRAAKGVEE